MSLLNNRHARIAPRVASQLQSKWSLQNEASGFRNNATALGKHFVLPDTLREGETIYPRTRHLRVSNTPQGTCAYLVDDAAGVLQQCILCWW